MRLLVKLSLSVVALALIVLALLTFVSSQVKFDTSGDAMDKAVYLAECGSGAPSEGPPGCDALATQAGADWRGVALTDPDVLLAEVSNAHASGAVMLNISGLFLAAAAIVLAIVVALPSGKRVTSLSN